MAKGFELAGTSFAIVPPDVLWVVDGARLLRLEFATGSVEGAAVAAGARLLGVGADEGIGRPALAGVGAGVRLLRWPEGELHRTLDCPGGDPRWVGQVAATTVVLGRAGLFAFDAEGTLVWSRRLESPGGRCVLAQDGTRLAVAMADAVGIFAISDGSPIERIGVRGAPLRDFCVAWPWRAWFLACHAAGVVYRAGTRDGVRVFETTCVPPGVVSMDVTASGGLVCLLADGTLGEWRSDGVPLGVWRQHAHVVPGGARAGRVRVMGEARAAVITTTGITILSL